MSFWREQFRGVERIGFVEQVIGLKIIAQGPPAVFVGECCHLVNQDKNSFALAMVIGFTATKVYLLPLENFSVVHGTEVLATGRPLSISAGDALRGHCLNALAEPLAESINSTAMDRVLAATKAINPLTREAVGERLITNIAAIDILLPLGKGQRTGIFAGSGVGKSTLVHQLVHKIQTDIKIIALIGERGREVQDFVQSIDGDTRQSTIIIAACSDDFALLRRQAAYTAVSLAEYFCQQGLDVLLVVDSMTRFAMAQREIGLSLGEPATARGYTPSVFSLLPELVERCGNFKGKGSITALFTVLVDGDDFNEPIADAMRSLLDGHIILSRELMEQGYYPPIAILPSVSRLTKNLLSAQEYHTAQEIRRMLAIYGQYKEMVDLGVYKEGSNKKLDIVLQKITTIHTLLQNNEDELISYPTLKQRFLELLS